MDLYPAVLRHRIYNILESGCCLGPPLMIIERRGVAAFPLSPEPPKPPKPLGPQEFEQGSGFCYTVVISWEECYYCSSDLFNYVCPKLKVSCSVAKSRMNQSYCFVASGQGWRSCSRVHRQHAYAEAPPNPKLWQLVLNLYNPKNPIAPCTFLEYTSIIARPCSLKCSKSRLRFRSTLSAH